MTRHECYYASNHRSPSEKADTRTGRHCRRVTAAAIIDAIKRGKIECACVGGKFYISRDEAARYIESTAYKPDEA